MENISVEDLAQRLNNGEQLNLIDVRETDERIEFNIGGTHVALGRITSMDIDEIEHLKDEEVICYCRAGARSMRACLMLETFGFTNVKNLTGGMLEWIDKNKS